MFQVLLNRFNLSPERLKRNKSLHLLGRSIEQPDLWHISRHSIPRAVAIGLFWAMIPMPMQMLAAALCALPWRANLPVSIGLVWLTNPITMPPVFYANYKLGSWLLGTPAIQMPDSITLEWIVAITSTHWQPLYFGSVVAGIVLAVLGYFSAKYYWQWKIGRNWQRRKKLRQRQLQEQR